MPVRFAASPVREGWPGRLARLGLASALAGGLGACGFALIGTLPLAPALQKVQLVATQRFSVTETPFQAALQARLARRGATLTDAPGPDVTTLRVESVAERRDVVATGPDGKALEYQITSEVRVQPVRNGQPLGGPRVARIVRSYTYNSAAALAKDAEEARLRALMQADLAEQVLIQLEVSLPPDPDAPPVLPGEAPRGTLAAPASAGLAAPAAPGPSVP